MFKHLLIPIDGTDIAERAMQAHLEQVARTYRMTAGGGNGGAHQ